MEAHIATRKDHRCDICEKRIPIGARYFSIDSGSVREHTNCLDFENEEYLPVMYNNHRTKGAAKDEDIRRAYD